MPYPLQDSAYNYTYTIDLIDPHSEMVRVTYSPADSDSLKPSMTVNLQVALSDMMDSTQLHAVIKDRRKPITFEWLQRARTQAMLDSDGFDPNYYQGQTFTARHKYFVNMPDSYTNFNPLTKGFTTADSEDNDKYGQVELIYSLTDSQKENFLNSLATTPLFFRERMRELGRLDSIKAELGYDDGDDSDSLRITWEYGERIHAMGDLATRIKSILNVNDSDFGQIIIDAGVVPPRD